jgi:hypothetical protein
MIKKLISKKFLAWKNSYINEIHRIITTLSTIKKSIVKNVDNMHKKYTHTVDMYIKTEKKMNIHKLNYKDINIIKIEKLILLR